MPSVEGGLFTGFSRVRDFGDRGLQMTEKIGTDSGSKERGDAGGKMPPRPSRYKAKRPAMLEDGHGFGGEEAHEIPLSRSLSFNQGANWM